MQPLFVVATGQYVGKTTLSLGLMSVMRANGLKVRFFKPVGQQYIEQQGMKIDKDAVLMRSALSLGGGLDEMSPVTVPRGFVENYLYHRDVEPLRKRIVAAYEHLRHECDVLLVEGTGHAGVGACFDLSNADVAAMLNAKTILVAEGGIGSTLDQVALNISVFRDKNVDVLGVIANKVFPEKRDRISQALGQGLSNMGLKLLGTVPFDLVLTQPRVRQIAEMLGADILCGHEALDRRIENVLVAAMEPQHVLPWMHPSSLMITAGDRIDNLLLAISAGVLPGEVKGNVTGIVLTGGLTPHETILNLVKRAKLPILLCKDDTYGVTSKVQNMVFRIQPEDTDKIEHAQNLVRNYVDVDGILNSL